MPDIKKYDIILDALQKLLEEKTIQNISVSEIAQKAGIGKGSIYYYFPSKDAILDALIERSYETPLLTAKNLAAQTDIPPFTRMAMLFHPFLVQFFSVAIFKTFLAASLSLPLSIRYISFSDRAYMPIFAGLLM